MAVPPALLGLGLGPGGRAGPGRRRGQLFAALWRSWRASVDLRHRATRGGPTRPRCAPGRGAGCTAPWSTETPLDAASSGAALAGHAGFLRRHLESDVGGNHLIKNLKALAGLAVFFGDEPLLRRSLRRLTAQLAVQVLPDGGHYERAPAYHCQVLADLIDVADLLSAAGQRPRRR